MVYCDGDEELYRAGARENLLDYYTREVQAMGYEDIPEAIWALKEGIVHSRLQVIEEGGRIRRVVDLKEGVVFERGSE